MDTLFKKTLFQYSISPSESLKEAVEKEIRSHSIFYALFNTEGWIFVTAANVVPVFFTKEAAIHFVKANCVEQNPELREVGYNDILMKVEQLKKKEISSICFLYNPVLKYHLSLSSLERSFESIIPEDISVSSKELILVPEIRAFLDAADPAERQKFNASLRYENIHYLLGDLLAKNHIAYSTFDQDVDLPTGFTASFCKDSVGCLASKVTIQKILKYFGLEQYTYQFRKYSKDIINELSHSNYIDVMSISPATGQNPNAYSLTNIKRGLNPENLYIYRLQFTRGDETIFENVSTPVPFILGNQFLIERPTISAPTQIPIAPTPEPTPKEEPDPVKDAVIGYFRRKSGINAAEAKHRFEKLALYPNILNEFYFFVKNHKYGKLNVHGYTMRVLVERLGFSPYDACIKLTELIDKSRETRQYLKYRETDPQYKK